MQNDTRMVIVKTMTVSKDVNRVYDFFEDVKNMETGGILTSITKTEDGWWTFDTPIGKAKMKLNPAKSCGIIDHVFVGGGGIQWDVYVRIIPNKSGSTTTWTFIRPDGLTDQEFEEQLKGFETEIKGWKDAIEKLQ